MKKVIIFLLLLFIVGCSSKPAEQIITAGVIMDSKGIDYSKFEVLKLEGEGECAGTEAEPCIAIAHFEVTEKTRANPMQLLEIDTPIRQVKGYSKIIDFEPGHDYTLKYEVLKLNPTDTIKWKFAGIE